MKYAIAEKHGRRVCDVIQMLEAFAVAFNHREDDKRLMMKVSAHLLGETQVLNFEAMTRTEAFAAYNKAAKEDLDDEARRGDEEFHRKHAESD
jgi:hypothetical protein